ncbi:MAG: T9SS type A sorting domain-containing protein [Candidatus Latescibacteria bacterium]|nr:T9SS type A sorting domain-containing protein [Candidatus Latescibacterota bacterium]
MGRWLACVLLLALLVGGAALAETGAKKQAKARRGAATRPMTPAADAPASGPIRPLVRALAPNAVQATSPSNIKVGLLSDGGSASDVKNGLAATGFLSAENITVITDNGTTPTLAQLQAFDVLLVWTNSEFSDPVATGNVLADYVDGGGGLVLGTYAFSDPWSLEGRIVTNGYSPFQVTASTKSPSGTLDMATAQTGHPIFDGVSSLTYQYNSNYTDSPLNEDAVLLARDTAGNKVIATNTAGTVVGISIFMGYSTNYSSPNVTRLFANALIFASTGGFGITTPQFVNTTPITLTGTAPDTTVKKVKVQVRDNPFVDAVLDTVAKTFSLANVSLNPDSNRVVAQGFTATDSLAAADTTVIILDQTSPVVDITSPADGDTAANNVTVQGTVLEKYLKQVIVRAKQVGGLVVDSTVATLTSDTTFTATVDVLYGGRYDIVVEAQDRVGQAARDSITVIVFSTNLVDEKGFLYDINTSDGTIDDGGNIIVGSSDSYDDWNDFTVMKDGQSRTYNGSGQVAYEENGREIVFPIDSTLAGLHISRKVFVPDEGGRFARYLNIVVNPADTAVTVDLKVNGDLGSDSSTNLRATSISVGTFSLSNVSVADYLWFVTDDEDTSDPTDSDAALAHVFDGLGGTDKADSVYFQQGNDEPSIFWKQVTIAPHDTVIYMMIESQRTLEAEVIAEARFITGLPPVLYAGMSNAELQKLKNFPSNPDSIFGDVTMQGGISAFDASLALRHTAEVLTLSPIQRLLADVSGNGIVGPLDVSLILRYLTKQVDTFPVRQLAVPKVIPGAAVAAVQDRAGQPGERVTIPIRVQKTANLFGADLVFRYDPAVLELIDAARTGLTARYELAYSHKEGRIHLALAGTAPLNEEGDLVALSFRVIGRDGGRSPLTVERFAVNELDMPGTSAEFVVGKATALIPKAFSLSQNRPNPFNPTTTIAYALPKPVAVRLVLYNVLGQAVRVLVDETQPAGFYTVTWDGRDGRGQPAASGVYFYRLDAGTFRQTKRLTLLK